MGFWDGWKHGVNLGHGGIGVGGADIVGKGRLLHGVTPEAHSRRVWAGSYHWR